MTVRVNEPAWNRIIVDMDGTLCRSYWPHGTEQDIPKLDPVPGSIAAIRLMKDKGYQIVIWTSRPESLRAVTEKWLSDHGVPYDELWMDKPSYLVFIDDRALNFDGRWEGTLGRAVHFRPWWQVADKPETFEEALDMALRDQRTIMVRRQNRYGPDNVRNLGLLGVLNRARQDKLGRIARVYEREYVRELCLMEGMPPEIVDQYLPSYRSNFDDESLEDAHIDAANYLGPISLMLLRGHWGLPLGEAAS